MKLFFAGAASNESIVYDFGGRNKILTYADIFLNTNRHVDRYWVEDGPREGACLFLDSGAFAGYTRGVKIDLEKYCNYVADRLDKWHCYAGLDVIGDHAATKANCEEMRRRGLEPIETFHKGSPMDELSALLDRSDYIALGGLVGQSTAKDKSAGARSATRDEIRRHLDGCWDIIVGHPRWPVRVHVFGQTSQWLLERYPFYSADSSGAILSAAMGGVREWVSRRESPGTVVQSHWREYGDSRQDRRKAPKTGDRRLVSFAHRLQAAVAAQLDLEDHVTEWWTNRGVTW